VPTIASGQNERSLTVRWPPKDGQPTPTLETERLAMSDNRAPLASGRAAHTDGGEDGKLTMNGDVSMKEGQPG
jgi:hypothetical protein